MTSVATSVRGRGRILVALALVATLLQLAPLPSNLAAAASTSPSDHPFSDPTWYPLRASNLSEVKSKDDWADPHGPYSALVACVKTNCGHKANDHFENGPHGTWAIDFVGDTGDDVYAAGSGVLHVERADGECNELRGNWVWIDHGGGVVSRYHHLSHIETHLDNTLVTPDTKIAEMGEGCNNTVDYLHFEVRHGGVYGERYNPGQLTACMEDGSELLYPQGLPSADTQLFATWDDLPWRHQDSAVPQAHNCQTGPPLTPERVPSIVGTFGDRRASVEWPDPDVSDGGGEADSLVIAQEIWRPTIQSWRAVGYTRLDDETIRRHLFTGLTNGRRYRFRVAYHNAEGNGAWSPYTTLTVGAPPQTPVLRRLSTWKRAIDFRWYKPAHNGYRVKGYEVAIRRATPAGWTEWTTAKQPVRRKQFRIFRELRKDTPYQMRVRASSDAGLSGWSSKHRITTAE